jgi:hypothetical protein
MRVRRRIRPIDNFQTFLKSFARVHDVNGMRDRQTTMDWNEFTWLGSFGVDSFLCICKSGHAKPSFFSVRVVRAYFTIRRLQ